MMRRLLAVGVVATAMSFSMATEDQPQAAPLRQFGPYGRNDNNYENNNYRNPNRDSLSLEDLYANHKFDDFNEENQRPPNDNGFRTRDSGFRSMADQHRMHNQGAGRPSRPGPVRRMGGMQDYDYNPIDRSGGGGGGGYGGGGGSIDVYSILALGLFAAFLGYIVYYYISVNGGGRSIGSEGGETMLKVIDDVTNAIERWALFEFLPGHLDDFSQLFRR